MSFQLHAAAGNSTTYCLGGPGSCSGGDWLSILSADGGADFSQVMGCVPDCTDCQPIACSNLCIATPALGDAGAHTTWDGTYLQHTTCGASTACTNSKCAPAGSYIARMCGFPETDASFGAECTGTATPTCVDVPFVWPPPSGMSTVEATVGGTSGDAGASD